MIGIMLFSLLASYGAYAAFIDDDVDSDSDDDSDDQVQAEAPDVETETDTSDGEDQTDNEDQTEEEDLTEGEDTVSVSLDEYLSGTDASDELRGGDGNDSLVGGKGGDLLLGGSGDDMLAGEEWEDSVNGGQGDDLVAGGRADDLLYGAGGDDALYGDGQNDTLLGGGGRDTLWGGDGEDVLIDTSFKNTFYGEGGDDTIVSAGNFDQGSFFDDEQLRTGPFDWNAAIAYFTDADASSADILYGDEGDDSLLMGGGDTGYGGEGSDTFVVLREHMLEANQPAIVGDFDASTDMVEYTLNSNVTPDLSINYEDGYAELLDGETLVMRLEGADESFTLDHVVVSGIFSSPEEGDVGRVWGSPQNDAYMGSEQDESFYGQSGDDLMVAGDGNDTFVGGADDDIALGEAGDDYLEGESGSDVLDGGEGDDTLFGATGNDLLNGVGGTLTYADFVVSGSETYLDVRFGEDTISTEGNDLIKGGPGQDFFIAGGGDTIDGRDGEDALVLVETADSDEIITLRAFEPTEDVLMIKYEGDVAPVVTTVLDDDGQGTMIYLDGVAFAQINQALPDGYDLASAIGLESLSA